MLNSLKIMLLSASLTTVARLEASIVSILSHGMHNNKMDTLPFLYLRVNGHPLLHDKKPNQALFICNNTFLEGVYLDTKKLFEALIGL